MPNNLVIYYGVVLLVVTVLLWIGAQLTKHIEWLLPYAGAVAVLMVVVGFIHELWKKRAAKQPFAAPPEQKDESQPK